MTRLQEAYRHAVQQAILRQVLRSTRQTPALRLNWQTGGIFVLFSAAAVCGTLAQAYLG